MKFILVATRNQMAGKAIETYFGSEYVVHVESTKESCFNKFRERRHEFTFIDIELFHDPHPINGHFDYKTALQPFWNVFPSAQIIILSGQEMIREAVMAVKAGASNYLTYPINSDELNHVIESIHESIRMQSELDYLRDSFWEKDSLEVVQSRSPGMKGVFEKIKSVAPTKSTVLLTGETGTGKGLFARLIHRHSNRKDAHFISVHCGAIPDTLLESELFGHEKGAFTGADRRKLGKFEIANGGTIFLDEIGTITPSAQIKLLQVLQEKMFQRVGGEVDIEVDVRIIAATNIDLKKMYNDGYFRNDLYYRLSVFPIEVPPLRERKEDIPLLAEFFLKRLNKLYSKEIRAVDARVLESLEQYPWPGNIREMENLIERAYILENSSILTPESFPVDLFMSEVTQTRITMGPFLTLTEARQKGVENIERRYLKEVLTLNSGRIKDTAKAAGIGVRQLNKLMRKYEIRKEEFKYNPTR
jgi:DNA-binding NtrC family response regulator